MEPHTGITTVRQLGGVRREFSTLLWNLFCGIRILLLRSAAIRQCRPSYDQLFLLVLLSALIQLTSSYAMTETPLFTLWGFGYLGFELLTTLLIGYLISKTTGDHSRLLLFMVVSYSASPLLYIAALALPQITTMMPLYLQLTIILWSLLVMFLIAFALVGQRWLKATFITLIWLLLLLPTTEITPGFWHEDYRYEDDEITEIPLDEEGVFYSQPQLLASTLGPVKSGEPGREDLFFVGFGAYASQDVFMKEVEHIQRAVDTKLGTHNRSVVLINNRKTVATTPLASSTNLGITLQQIGARMDQEDVLLLYLTSHGSREHQLEVEMWPLGLNNIAPTDLKKHLDNAAIRWRILLVSACYSGGFVEPLKDDHTLIVTAAAHDKTSFGCASENEFTYFGEALFKALPEGPFQFIRHFEAAITTIAQREKSESLEPSQPQLFIGELMREKLNHLEREIENYPAERFLTTEANHALPATPPAP